MPDGTEYTEYRALPDFENLGANVSIGTYTQRFVNLINRLYKEGVLSYEEANHYMAHYATRMTEILNAMNLRTDVPLAKVQNTISELGLQSHMANMPFYKQTVAYEVYQQLHQQRATAYGYEADSSQYATEMRKAQEEAADFISGWIASAKAELPSAITPSGRTREEVLAEHEQRRRWQGWQEYLDFVQSEQGQPFVEAQRRAELWAGQREAARLPTGEPTLPSYEEGVTEFLRQTRPSGLQQFIESRMPEVLERAGQEIGGARQAWWAAINRPSYEEELQAAQWEVERWQTEMAKPGHPIFGKAATEMTPSEWLQTIAPRKLQEAQARLEQLQGMTPTQTARTYREYEAEDPLEAYLREYPFQEEYLRLSPGQRGFYPSRYQPQARWFV